ncbi:MAG: Nif11-like leader peptide family natural product precursor [Prochlorococcaceae cyanobacterium]
MSKAQLGAFFTKVDLDPALQQQVHEAKSPGAIVAIAKALGHPFTEATLARHQRG